MRRATASATSSRGASSSTKRSPPASSSSAPSPRTASVTRKPSAPFAPATAVGWNCIISRSASAAPAACASTIPAPTAPAGFVVRDHSAAAPPVASTTARADDDALVVQAHADAASGGRRQRDRAAVLQHLDPLVLGDERRQLARHAPAGRGAAGVHDPAHGVAALEAEREASAAIGVEAHAEPFEVAHGRRRFAREDLRRAAPDGAAPCAQRVLEVLLARVVERQHGRQAALRPVARRLRERVALTSATRPPAAAAVSAAYSPAAPAPTTATSASIVAGAAMGASTVLGWAARSTCPTPPRWSTTRARIRSAPRASWRSSRSWRATTGSGWSGSRRRASRARR